MEIPDSIIKELNTHYDQSYLPRICIELGYGVALAFLGIIALKGGVQAPCWLFVLDAFLWLAVPLVGLSRYLCIAKSFANYPIKSVKTYVARDDALLAAFANVHSSDQNELKKCVRKYLKGIRLNGVIGAVFTVFLSFTAIQIRFLLPLSAIVPWYLITILVIAMSFGMHVAIYDAVIRHEIDVLS